jgi:hypothetical protein
MKRTPRVALTFLISFFAAVAATAQTPSGQVNAPAPATRFADLRSLVDVRLTPDVVVTDLSGRRTRGKLIALAGDSLSISTFGQTQIFPSQRIRQLQRRLPDSKREGALVGFVAGWLPPAFVCTSRSDSSETIPCVTGALLLGGIPGLFIGMAVDAVLARAITIYQSPFSTRIDLTPIITPHEVRVQASIRLRSFS